MATCMLCGKNINILTSGVITLPEDDNNAATYINPDVLSMG